jgi:hypothetical protein
MWFEYDKELKEQSKVKIKKPHPLILLLKEKDGTSLQIQTMYLPIHL